MYRVKTVNPIYRDVTEIESEICKPMWGNTMVQVKDKETGHTYMIPISNIVAFRKFN